MESDEDTSRIAGNNIWAYLKTRYKLRLGFKILRTHIQELMQVFEGAEKASIQHFEFQTSMKCLFR